MVITTDNHGYRLFADGESGWEHRIDLEALEVEVMVRDVKANRDQYTSHDNAFFLATDTGECYLGDGSAWNKIGSIAGGGGGGGSGGGRSTIRAVDRGADPTGAESSAAALQDAVDAASPGDRVIWGESGTYYLDDKIEITKRIEVDLFEGTIESDYHDELAYPNDQEHYMPLIHLHGEQGQTSTLSQSRDRGDDQITVNDPSLYEVGDGVVIRNNNTGRTTVPLRNYRPTCTRIREIDDNNVLYLEDGLEIDYAAGEYVTIANYLDRPVLRNVTVRPRREPTFDPDKGKVLGGPRHVVATDYCDQPLIQNVDVEGYDSHLWTGYDDRAAKIIDCTATKPMNLSGSCGEPFYISGSSNPVIVRPVVRGCRRGIDLRSGASKVTVIRPTVTGISFVGASWHSTSDVMADMHIVGGRFDCRPEDPTMDNKDGTEDRRQELQRGRAFHTGVHSQFTAVGTRFISNIDSVINGKADVLNSEIYKYSDVGTVLTLSGEDIHLTGTDVGSSGPVNQLVTANSAAENISMTEVTFNCSGAPSRAIYIDAGQHIEIDGHVTDGATRAPIEIVGGSDIELDIDITANGDYAALIDLAENVSLTGRIEGSCANEIIQVDGGSDISIDCVMDASGGSAVRGVRAFNPDHLDITGAYTGPSEGVRFSGGATHTVIHDMQINVTDVGTDSAIRADTSATGLSALKILNNDLRGEADDINLEVDVNGLWAIDNLTSAVTYTAGSTIGREEGNLDLA